MSRFRFTAGPWNVHEGADAFGPNVRSSIPFGEKVKKFAEIGLSGVQAYPKFAQSVGILNPRRMRPQIQPFISSSSGIGIENRYPASNRLYRSLIRSPLKPISPRPRQSASQGSNT
jgi:hypothetical protein